MTCSVEGCSAQPRARGLCNSHYKRLRRLGDVRPGQPVQVTKDDDRRFWQFVSKTDGCWMWAGAITLHGYPRFTMRSGQVQAHRLAYEKVVGAIPEGLELDHLCRVRHCVNPDHLEPVTHAENMRRAAAAVTHCPRGHAYDEANTYHPPKGGRSCRTCTEASRQRYAVRILTSAGGQ